MKKTFLISVLSLLMGACVTTEDVPGCEKLGGQKSVTISYSERGITVTPHRSVKRKSVFIVRLDPKTKSDRERVVTIVGMSVTPGGDGVKDPNWLDTSDNYNTRKRFAYCSPDTPADEEKKAQVYKYSVDVEGLGLIDPRVEVTH